MSSVNQVMDRVLEAIKKDPHKMLREFYGQEIQSHRREIRYHERKITELKKEISSLAPKKGL